MVHCSLWSRVKMVEVLNILGIVLHFGGGICSKSRTYICCARTDMHVLLMFVFCYLLNSLLVIFIKMRYILILNPVGPGKSETARECVAEEGTVYPVCDLFTMCSLISQVSVSASSPHSFLLNCHLQPITQQTNSPGLSLPLSLKHSYLDRETSLILRNIAGKPSHLLTKVTPAPLLSHGRVLCLLW